MPSQILLRSYPSDSPTLLPIQLIVEFPAGRRFPLLLVPEPGIDGGVEQIGDQISEDDAEDHGNGDCFIH